MGSLKQEYQEIFNQSYPQFSMTNERFRSLFNEDTCVFFEHAEEGKVVAFAIMEEFAIRLLCVAPAYRLRGIGRSLLDKIEAYAKEKGNEKIITGGVSSKLFIGADSDTWGFFEKNGFEKTGECDEMLLKLADFSKEKYSLHGHDIAEYGWFEGDLKEIQAAVGSVEENWVQYYDRPENIYVARVNGQIASFCLVDTDFRNYLTDAYGRVGLPGCVGSVPEYRNKGIALEMIANVTEYLKEQGMDISFIFYTGVADWYAKIGYTTFLTEIFGVKKL